MESDNNGMSRRSFVGALGSAAGSMAAFTIVPRHVLGGPGYTAPSDMVTMANVDIKPLSPLGITAEALKPNQRELLTKLIDVYVGFMAPDIAADRTAKLKKAGIDKIGFAWAGEAERGKKHYYRVQGPTFLIEYDNTQNDGNHIHSVWRDFDGDFGRDLLREHLKSTPHH